MNITLLKSILLGVMAIVTLVFGTAPIFVLKRLTGGDTHVPFSNRATLTISLISCFAGGVFFAVCFLDIMPDSLEAWEQVQKQKHWSTDYPIVPLIFCLGFFSVGIFEEITARICGSVHDEKHHALDVDRMNETQRPDGAEEIASQTETVNQPEIIEHKNTRSFTLVTAFLFHVGLEGFAFGVQNTTFSVLSLFLGIIVHKAVISFSVGMRLAQDLQGKNSLIVLLITTIAIVAALGGGIGIVLENSNINTVAKNIVTMIMLCFSLGAFIYITFFEILCPEHFNHHSNIAQWISTLVGFGIIALLMIVGH